MSEERSEQVQRVATVLDIALTVGVFLAAPWLRNGLLDSDPVDVLSHVAFLPFVLALWIFSLRFFGAYRSPRMTSLLQYAWAVTRGVAVGLASLLTVLFVFKVQYVSRGLVAVFAATDLVALVAVRAAIVWDFHPALRRGEHFRPVLIVGSGTRAKRLAETLLRNSEWGLRIVGHLDPDPTKVGEPVLESCVLGTVGDISSVLKENVIDEVILAVPRAMIPDVDKIAQACEEEGVKLCLMADVFDVRAARTRLVALGAIPLLTLEPVAQEEW